MELTTEEQHWFWVLTFFRQIILQVVERVGENPASFVHASLTDAINTLDTELETKPHQPPPTPDMSPIIMPEIESLEVSMPCFPMSEIKLNVMIDKTQDIILELLINTAEIYLTQEEVFRKKEIENTAHSSKQKYGKGSK